MFTVQQVSSAIWANPENTLVDTVIETEELGTLPITVDMANPEGLEHFTAVIDYVRSNPELVAPFYVEPLTIEQRKLALKADVERLRDEALEDPNATVTTSGGIVWQVPPSAMKSLNEALTLFTAMGSTPEGYEWRDIDDVKHPAALSLLVEIGAARSVQLNSIWQQSWALKDLIDEAKTEEELNAIQLPDSLKA